MLVGLVHLPPGLETTLEAAVELEEWPQEKKGGVALEEPGGGQRKGRGISSGFLLFSFFIT